MTTMKVFDGTAWQTASLPAGTNATTFVGPEAPPGPLKLGDLWYDTDDVSTLALPMSIVNGGTGVSTAAAARTSLAMPGEELAYAQITATVSATATTSATAQLVVDGGTRTYDGSPVIIEFYSAYVEAFSGQWALVSLRDGATELGMLAQVGPGTGQNQGAAVHVKCRITPTAGSHNYRIHGWTTGNTAKVSAGAGGGANYMPAYIRVTRA
jgi:hypothetical protein